MIRKLDANDIENFKAVYTRGGDPTRFGATEAVATDIACLLATIDARDAEIAQMRRDQPITAALVDVVNQNAEVDTLKAEIARLRAAIGKLRDASGQAIVDAMRELFAITEASQ